LLLSFCIHGKKDFLVIDVIKIDVSDSALLVVAIRKQHGDYFPAFLPCGFFEEKELAICWLWGFGGHVVYV
jgi:hypothetical protein